MSAKITSINFSWKDNYVSYNDTDAMTDYFHGYSLNQKSTIEWVKDDGADKIHCMVTNNDIKIPFLRRIKQICKVANYTYEDLSHIHEYRTQNFKEFVYSFELTKIKD